MGVFHYPYEGDLIPIRVFYPKYYQTMCVRLYNFDGLAVDKESPVVISYEEKVDNRGTYYREIKNIQDFDSTQEALDYIESEESLKHSIVGINPFVSPVKLEAIDNYRLVYASEYVIDNQELGTIPEVKIYEYLGE